MSLSSGFFKKLREGQLRNAIKKVKDKLKGLKNIFNKIKKLELLREQEINETKRMLNMLDDEISGILEKLDVNLTTCKKPHDFEKERELRLLAKEKNEIKRLKEEVKNKEDELLNNK